MTALKKIMTVLLAGLMAGNALAQAPLLQLKQLDDRVVANTDITGSDRQVAVIDGASNRITNSSVEVDVSGNLVLKPSGKLTASGQGLLLEAPATFDTEVRAASGQQVAVTYGAGAQTAFYADDSNGNVLVRAKGLASTGSLQSSTANPRFFWAENLSQMRFGDGSAGVYVLDTNGFTVLKGYGTGGVALQNIEATINMLTVDSGNGGGIVMRPQAAGNTIILQDGAGTPRIVVSDDTANGVYFRDGSNTVTMAQFDGAGNGDVTVRPVATGDITNLADGLGASRIWIQDTFGLVLYNSGGTIPMIHVDPASSPGELVLRAEATGDQVQLRDSANVSRVTLSDTDGVRVLNDAGNVAMFFADLAAAPGEVALRAEATGDQVQLRDGLNTLRVSVSDTDGIRLNNSSGGINMIRVDTPDSPGELILQPEANGDSVQLRDGDGILRVTVTDNATATYEVSIAGDVTTTGELDVGKSIREHGDQFVTSTPHTIATTASRYFYNTTSGSITATLPTISASTRGSRFVFFYDVKSGSNTVTIQRASTDTIEGATSVVLDTQNDKMSLYCPSTGTDWKIENEVSGSGVGGGNIIGGGQYSASTGGAGGPDSASLTGGAVTFPANTGRIRVLGTHIHSAAAQIQGSFVLDFDLNAGTVRSIQQAGGAFTLIGTSVPTGTVTASQISSSQMQVSVTATTINILVTHTAGTSSATGYAQILYFD